MTHWTTIERLMHAALKSIPMWQVELEGGHLPPAFSDRGLRHSNLSVTNKYLQAASKTKRNAQARLVEAILPMGAILPAGSKKQDAIQTKQSVFVGAMGNA